MGVVQGVEQVVPAEDEAALDGGVQLAGGVEQARAVAAGDAKEGGGRRRGFGILFTFLGVCYLRMGAPPSPSVTLYAPGSSSLVKSRR